jgi:hypothetical protein
MSLFTCIIGGTPLEEWVDHERAERLAYLRNQVTTAHKWCGPEHSHSRIPLVERQATLARCEARLARFEATGRVTT